MLLKNIRINDGRQTGRTTDLAVRNGIIAAIGDALAPESGEEVIDGQNAHVSAGWVDIGVHACDPGFEHREDLRSAARAAAAGGFTKIAVQPNTRPAIDDKASVLYIRNKAAGMPAELLPLGAISQQAEGKDLAELYDMHSAGAIAFTDGSKSVQDAGLLLRALQYTQAFGGLVINRPYHKTVAGGGQMHEGIVSTMLGLKGTPALAEEMIVQRDLSLLEYAGGRLHIHLVSTAKSVALIRAAKAAGMPVTASVAIANLCFTDEKLLGFDSNWKVQPPLRAQSDIDALLDGLRDGTIDCICTNHTPWDEEAKNLEFPYAEFGMTALETAYSLSRTFSPLGAEAWVDKVALGPRRVLGLPAPEIREGAVAELTVFHPEQQWTPERAGSLSKSLNSPFFGVALTGRVLRTAHSR